MRSSGPSATAPRRTLAMLLAAVAWAGSSLWLVALLFAGLALRCDEACYGGGWRHDHSACQWNVAPTAGAIGFLCGTALILAVRAGRRAVAMPAAVIGTAAIVAGGSWLEPGWWSHVGRHPHGTVLWLAGGAQRTRASNP